ncbi:hypothetical protein [Sinorhizobium fredii]|uniref:hypothetical protein n=1 Tax=Rhizobium fredii TaxID=380 RepID=UPI003390F125
MEKKSRNNTRPREGRSHVSRLTINIPKGTLTALKIHVAQRETTIREIVTDLIEKEIGKTPIWPKLWLVAEGEVTEADETTESDGVNNVLALYLH